MSQFSVFNSIESLNNILPVLVCEKVRNVSGTLGFLAAYLTAAGDLGGGPPSKKNDIGTSNNFANC